MPADITITADGDSLTLHGSPDEGLHSQIAIPVEYIDGWYSTPDPKVSATERTLGHGAFPVPDEAVLYGTRTCQVAVRALGDNRDQVTLAARSLSRMMGRTVDVRVTDDAHDTVAMGAYLSVSWESTRYRDAMDGKLTIVCPDPRRYGLRHRMALSCGSLSGGGLQWTSGGAVSWPLDWGDVPASGVCTLTNAGNSTAYPTISVFGLSNPEVRTSEGGSLRLHGWVPWSTPLVLDCASETATISGVDVTSRLASRDFPRVDPGGSLTLTLSADGGSGHADVELLDTYI